MQILDFVLVVYVEYFVSTLVVGTSVVIVFGLSMTVWVVMCLGRSVSSFRSYQALCGAHLVIVLGISVVFVSVTTLLVLTVTGIVETMVVVLYVTVD